MSSTKSSPKGTVRGDEHRRAIAAPSPQPCARQKAGVAPYQKMTACIAAGRVEYAHDIESLRSYRPLSTPHLTEDQMIALGTPTIHASQHRRERH